MSKNIEVGKSGKLKNGDPVRVICTDVVVQDRLIVLGLVIRTAEGNGVYETTAGFDVEGRAATELIGGSDEYSIDLDSLSLSD